MRGTGDYYTVSIPYLKYEGNLLNGRKNGKVREYNKYQELIFEGEYFNGEKNGIVK